MLFLAIGCGLVSIGCGGNPPAAPVQQIVAISGKVLVGGKPTERISITFHPVAEGQGREESCGTQEGGVYKTEIIAARYKVTFEPIGGANVPKAYRSKATTPVELDASGASMTKDFELK